jgi:hypothetical protein
MRASTTCRRCAIHFVPVPCPQDRFHFERVEWNSKILRWPVSGLVTEKEGKRLAGEPAALSQRWRSLNVRCHGRIVSMNISPRTHTLL